LAVGDLARALDLRQQAGAGQAVERGFNEFGRRQDFQPIGLGELGCDLCE